MVEPLLDLVEEGGYLLVEIAVPGILESDIDVTLDGSHLVVSADRLALPGSYLHRDLSTATLGGPTRLSDEERQLVEQLHAKQSRSDKEAAAPRRGRS